MVGEEIIMLHYGMDPSLKSTVAKYTKFFHFKTGYRAFDTYPVEKYNENQIHLMGFGNKKNSVDEWHKNERDIIRELCHKHGIELAEETKGRGKTYTPTEYKIIRDEVKEEVKNELRAEPDIMDELKAELRDDFIVEYGQKLINEAKITTKSEIEKIKTSLESEIKKVTDEAEEKLKQALAPIEEKIDVALAEKANSNVIKDIAVKKGLLVVLSLVERQRTRHSPSNKSKVL